ncbi:hypothetical protein BpHYR1_011504 [Brachionus plicatilis]|uniref:Uncharacterized protein n=1 Tax=Brachionus plicatilis TaxID=10195 RepID=A0A3M7S4H1_BRAPC|nr:hypothetical protein BpHYR1_011504 [Brachionus plicatilis]
MNSISKIQYNTCITLATKTLASALQSHYHSSIVSIVCIHNLLHDLDEMRYRIWYTLFQGNG